MSDFSNRLRSLIEELGVSYTELERLTGIPKSSLQRYATGITEKISMEKVVILAGALGVAPEYLIGWNTTSTAEDREVTRVLKDRPEVRELINVAKELSKDKVEALTEIAKVMRT